VTQPVSTPDGIFGYAKTIAAFVATVLAAVAGFLPNDWQHWAQAVIAALGVIAVYAVPNKVVLAVPPKAGE
jgi:hypothetical protein